MGRLLAFIFIGTIFILGIYTFSDEWKSLIPSYRTEADQERNDFRKAEAAMARGEYEEVLVLSEPYLTAIEQQTPVGQQWLSLLIQASTESKNLTQLTMLFEHSPNGFSSNEKASLIVANGYLVSGNSHNFEVIRALWRGRETKTNDWSLLDVDKKLIDGKRAEAIAILRSSRFEGKDDARRSIRLATILVMEDPKKAWESLLEAEKSDPTNSDIYLYKGRLLSGLGKHDLAIQQYLIALKYNSQNPFLWELLGDQYISIGDIDKGLDAYQNGIKQNGQQSLWLKTLFWTKAALPKEIKWTAAPIPPGKLEPLIQYYLKLGPKEFWDSTSFNTISNGSTYLKTQQSAYLLYLLKLLEEGDESQIATLLSHDPFVNDSWNPKLMQALRELNDYRIRQKQPLDQSYDAYQVSSSFLETLNTPTDNWPQWAHDLASSPDAYAVVLIQAGWSKSGLELLSDKALPPSRPDRTVLDIMSAYQTIDGSSKRALSYALSQERTPTLSMEIARIYLEQQQTQKAVQVLNQTSHDSNEGFSAKEMLLELYLAQGEWKQAALLIHDVPPLAETVQGKEVLAKQALEIGDLSTASKIYNNIVEQSAEAKSFLARKAYNEKDYNTAKKLTEQLIHLHPDSTVLRENLQKIIQEQNRYNHENS